MLNVWDMLSCTCLNGLATSEYPLIKNMEEVEHLLELCKIWSDFETALYSKLCIYFNTEGTAKLLYCVQRAQRKFQN